MQERNYYKRNLPHWQPSSAEFFITFRLAGSLPAEVVARIRNEKDILLREAKERSSGSLPEQQVAEDKAIAGSDRLSDLRAEIWRKTFRKYERLLDTAEKDPMWLAEPAIARIVQDAIHYRDRREYDLYAYCIMPNHVHLIFKLIVQSGVPEKLNEFVVTDILKSLKWFTALKANQILQREGAFWQSESYDRVIRDTQELENCIAYTLENPVKAGLVNRWEDWAYSYCKPEFVNDFS